MTTPDPLEESMLRRLPLEILAAGAVLGLLALPVFGPGAALFVAAGGGVAALGFLWMRSAVTRVLSREKRAALRSAVLVAAARFALILGVLLLIILFFPGRVLAFAAGFSAPLPVFLAEAAVAHLRVRTWKS
jgi:hypothetical protein